MTKDLFGRFFPAAALLIALAWPAHIAFAHHDAEGDCQVCSVSCSPQLNSDCGSALLQRPSDSGFIAERRTFPVPAFPEEKAFLGRAPPLN